MIPNSGTNRPHFHPWLLASTGRAYFRCRGFFTRQAARQWALRRRVYSHEIMVLACTDPQCKPALP